MATQPEGQDLFTELLAAGRAAFAREYFESAYSFLTAALQLAFRGGDAERLGEVERLAAEQADWVDANRPGHPMSRRCTEGRPGGRVPYSALARLAATMGAILRQPPEPEEAEVPAL